jgi:hypothetical protein
MDSDDSTVARRVFGSANLEENFDVFLWLLDRMDWHDLYREAPVPRARAAGFFYRIGNIPAAVSKCKPSLTSTNEQ